MVTAFQAIRSVGIITEIGALVDDLDCGVDMTLPSGQRITALFLNKHAISGDRCL